MKHDVRIIALLVVFYLIAQLIGLGVVYSDIKVDRTVTDTGQIVVVVSHPETALGPRPEVYNFDAILMMLVGVLIGTSLVMLIVKFNKVGVWKIFFFSAVFFSLTITFGVFFSWQIAASVGFVLAFVKLWRHNIIVHNVTEVLVYSGIAVLFAPLFEPIWVVGLLLLISAYDAFAVWKSKHMIKMAEFQIDADVFAGLSIPYKSKQKSNGKKLKHNTKDTGVSQAILGGGDIAFPLIFAASVMEAFIKSGVFGFSIFIKTLPIPIITAITLLFLMVWGKRGHYYPAMPFLTIGCLIGYAISLIL